MLEASTAPLEPVAVGVGRRFEQVGKTDFGHAISSSLGVLEVCRLPLRRCRCSLDALPPWDPLNYTEADCLLAR